ncbi:MAG: anaerobic ribonucleoside-triphosphate reductase activating protein [Clostridiales bacterium]|nr:anaerobic ribonucleoside-triphosphate reductase activating protein [Clostridiales bacterium]
MNYHNITHDDMKNGDGLRTVLWVSGCSHHCPGCHNPITWDASDGIPFDRAAEDEIFSQLNEDYISGLTLSGGDPLFPANREEVTALAKDVKESFPNKNIWLYTGYLWEEIKDLEIIKYTDVLVDGRFIKALKDNNLKWRGSENQRVIDVKKSIETGSPVLHCD